MQSYPFLAHSLMLYHSRPESTQTRSASEVGKVFPRLRSLKLRAAPFAGKWTSPPFASLYRHNILYCKRFRLRDAERPGVVFPREASSRGC